MEGTIRVPASGGQTPRKRWSPAWQRRPLCYTGGMLIVHVHVHVRPDQVEAFKTATIENARLSVQEPGIARFDIAQQPDDPTRFILIEAYRDENAPLRHKETPHYLKWRDAVADMMAEPRRSVKFNSVFLHEPGRSDDPFI